MFGVPLLFCVRNVFESRCSPELLPKLPHPMIPLFWAVLVPSTLTHAASVYELLPVGKLLGVFPSTVLRKSALLELSGNEREAV